MSEDFKALETAIAEAKGGSQGERSGGDPAAGLALTDPADCQKEGESVRILISDARYGFEMQSATENPGVTLRDGDTTWGAAVRWFDVEDPAAQFQMVVSGSST